VASKAMVGRWLALGIVIVLACILANVAADAKSRSRGTSFTETSAKTKAGHRHKNQLKKEASHIDSLLVTEADPCEGTHCMRRSECAVTDSGVPYCRCKKGYRGNGFICTEINPCLDTENPCGVHGYCVHPKHGDPPATYTCECAEKYTFDGKTCVAVDDPCVAGTPCGPFGACNTGANTNSYTCECQPGYYFDSKTCVEDDPCYSNPCVHGVCRELVLERKPGGPTYECYCHAGWNYDGTTCQPDPCQSDPCANDPNAFCKVLAVGGYQCFCNEGFARDTKSKCEPEALVIIQS
jgi:hypothetical protein